MSTFAQRSFAGGELSPDLHARVDVVKYSTGLKTCRNFYVQQSSGATVRPGTEYIVTVKDSTKDVRLIPFVFNAAQTYMMEFGDQYIRFIQNGAQVEVSGVAAWVTATPYVVGDLVEESGTNYYCTVAHTSSALFATDAANWYALTGVIYEIPTPYLEADLAELNYVQSGDIVTITHQGYPVYDLSRTGNTAWTLVEKVFTPNIAAPENLAVSGGAGTVAQWKVTAIEDETFEESLPTAAVGASSVPTTSSKRTLTWDAVPGAREYNVYKNENDVYGFIGVAGETTFEDNGIDADTTDTPPINRTPFDSVNNYPATAAYFQQRLGFANTILNPEKTWFTKSASFNNLTTSAPIQDDDSVVFNLPGRRVNAIQQLIDLGNLIALTSGAEILVQGDVAGILRPGEINPKTESYNGSGTLRPLLLNDNALFVQARGNVIRDLFASIDAVGDIGYKGTDLTVFARHLFSKYTILDWDYAQIPNSIVWAVRSDGKLIGLTYLKDHQIWAWHRHDTDGTYKNVCVIPEGNEDLPYIVVERTISGSPVKYIERFTQRKIIDVVDYVGMDSVLRFDGRNTTATTMTLTGSGWTYQDDLTLTSSTSFFLAGDIGNQIYMRDASDFLVRCVITAFTSDTVVTVRPVKDVPVSLQGVAITDWDEAVDTVSGLDHLEGKEVSVYANGFVIASPNNSQYDTITVVGGSITLPKPFPVIAVGLPYICDLETLDIDSVNSETIVDKKKFITTLTSIVTESAGIWAGHGVPTGSDALEGLEEYKARENEDYESPTDLKTGIIEIALRPEWNSTGNILVRQVDPLPLTVLGIMPAGLFPFKGR